jgi:hypothetical protein
MSSAKLLQDLAAPTQNPPESAKSKIAHSKSPLFDMLTTLTRSFLTCVTLLACTGAVSVLAQAPSLPQPDRNGNYFSNEAPIQGSAPSPLMPGSLWQVVASGLNCRRNAGLNYGVVRQFHRGELLQADVGRGGADEVLLNVKDNSGNPWMRVRSSRGSDYQCYVRANRRYIQPYRVQN